MFSRMKLWLPAVLAIAALSTAACAIDEDALQRVSLPPMSKPPVIDGIINADEWAAANRIIGFVSDPRTGSTLVGYDDSNLYIAQTSELPPTGELVADVSRHDSNTCVDDSIEIWIDPNRSNRADKRGDQKYYQMIFNSAGVLFDASTDPDTGANLGWDLKGYQFKSTVDKASNTWQVEVAIPWKSLAVDPAQIARRQIGLMIARNWKSPWAQAPSMGGGFSVWQPYPVFTLDTSGLLVREESTGDVWNAKADYVVSITNPCSCEQKCKVSLCIDSTDMPSRTKSEEITLPDRGTVKVELAYPDGSLHNEAKQTISAKVTSLDGKTIYFKREFTAGPVRTTKWDAMMPPDPNKNLFIAYYPSMKKLAVKLDMKSATGGDKITGADIDVLDPAGKSIMTGAITMADRAGETTLELPDLQDGNYKVKATLKGDGAPTAPFEREFTRTHFVWENNIIGMTDKVYPPYEPVKAQGNTLGVVLRTFKMNGFGLWDSIVTKGREILAAPMTVEYQTADGTGRWTSKKGSFTASKPTLAVYEAAAASPAVKIDSTAAAEMDGCMKVTLTLTPGADPQTIKAMWINIPLKDEFAPLWHVIQSDGIRLNPTGSTPKGSGIVWDSTKTGNGPMLGNMIPYIWLGGPERGIAWFANNDKGMSLDDDIPAQTLTRENGRLTLRIYLINKPTKLVKPREIVFGLQASPTKPMPENWRAKTYIPYMGGSNGYWGIVPSFAGKYPAGGDYSYADHMLIARESRQYPAEFMKKWVDEKINANKDWTAGWKEDRTRHVGAGMGSITQAGATPTVLYIEEHRQDITTPEWVTFQDEWGEQPYTTGRQTVETAKQMYDKGLIYGQPICFNKSYQDFAVYHAMQWDLRGIGMYNDNCYPVTCFDPAKSDAYVRDDGHVQGSANIWELRAYHKRQWIAEQDCQPLTKYELYISNHMTNGNIIPVLTWGDVNLDNEWGWQGGNVPFPRDVLQTEMIGLQTGCYPHALYPVSGISLKTTYPNLTAEQTSRMEWGMRFVHEILRGTANPLEKTIRDLGYGKPECSVINYWNTVDLDKTWPTIKVDGDQVLWTGIWNARDKSLVLALQNWTNDRQSPTVTVTGPKGSTFASWTDAETGKPVTPDSIGLSGFQLKILKLSGK